MGVQPLRLTGFLLSIFFHSNFFKGSIWEGSIFSISRKTSLRNRKYDSIRDNKNALPIYDTIKIRKSRYVTFLFNSKI